jgi:uncharacterized protein
LVKIPVNQITESFKEIQFEEGIEDLNPNGVGQKRGEFRFPPFLNVNLTHYRSGQDLFFHGHLDRVIEACCSRCLRFYSFSLEKDFDFFLTPEPPTAKSRELYRDEMGLSFYSSEDINLSPFIRDQVLLALPMRPLCDEGCRGLCPSCGVNLNHESCLCPAPSGDTRMAFFRNLRLDR